MNILQLLRPKAMTAYIKDESTLRQALEKMKCHGYTAVPVIDHSGLYVGTLAEGDFLWFMLQNDISEKTQLEHFTVRDLPKRVKCKPVYVNSTLEDLFKLSMNQNFVPVVDDRGVFIGIVTRRDILQVCYSALQDTDIFSAPPEYVIEESKI